MNRRVVACAVLLSAVAAGGLTATAGAASGPQSDPAPHRASPPGGLSRAEPSVAVHPRQPDVVVTGANDDEGSTVAAYWSGDGGTTFTKRSPMPRAAGAQFESDPNLAFDSRGRVFMAYLTYGNNPNAGGLAVARSDDSGRTWPAEPTLVARNNLQGNRCQFHDFPAIAVDRRTDVVYVAWQLLTVVDNGSCTFGNNHPILLSRSVDGGRTWSVPVRMPERPGEIPYLPTLAVGPDGVVFVTYNSIRLTGPVVAGCPSSGAPVNVLVARSADQGRHFAASLAQTRCVNGTRVALPLVGLNSYTGATWRLPSSSNTVVDPVTGALVSVLGHQNPVTGRQRISVVRSVDGGRHWSNGGVVAEDPAFEQQMPRLAVGNDGRLSLVWLAQVPGGFLWPSHSWSRDDGRTWSPTQRLARAPSPRGGPTAQFFLGDYLGNAVGADGRAHPVWTDPREVDLDLPGGTIYTRAIVP